MSVLLLYTIMEKGIGYIPMECLLGLLLNSVVMTLVFVNLGENGKNAVGHTSLDSSKRDFKKRL
jgi:hypothetical protein